MEAIQKTQNSPQAIYHFESYNLHPSLGLHTALCTCGIYSAPFHSVLFEDLIELPRPRRMLPPRARTRIPARSRYTTRAPATPRRRARDDRLQHARDIVVPRHARRQVPHHIREVRVRRVADSHIFESTQDLCALGIRDRRAVIRRDGDDGDFDRLYGVIPE